MSRVVILALVVCASGRAGDTPPASPAPPPARVLAAPEFPDEYTERYSKEGKLMTDAGEAEYQDMLAVHGNVNLTLRRFRVPAKVWELKSTKQMLDDAKQNMLAGDPTMKLRSERDFVIDGFPGRSFVFTIEEGKSLFRMDYFLMKPDLFIYGCVGEPADLERPEVRAFFASIKTMEPPPEEANPPAEPASTSAPPAHP